MQISIIIISENINKNININANTFFELKNIFFKKYLIPLENQYWYINDNKIEKNFKIIKGEYSLYFFDTNYISLKINIGNNILNIPLIKNKVKVKELKNILSIKDNIYLNNKILNENYTLEYYNIKNNFILDIKPLLISIN